MEMPRDARIYVAGHRGLAGSAIWRELQRQGFTRLIGRSRQELDLLDQTAVRRFFEAERPDFVFLAAAKVGGIHANNSHPADFIQQNLQIQTNVIHQAHLSGTRKLLFLGSSCIYPKFAPQPLEEEYLLTGPLEPTNQWYAVAKIAGAKLCEAYRRQHGSDFFTVLPTNLYGPNDHYDLETSHVLPAFIRKFHEAKISGAPHVSCWGTGMPQREFLHADDLARACVFLMQRPVAHDRINVGSGVEITIRDLAELVCATVGYAGAIEWDSSKPDGTPRKLLDSSRISSLGWRPSIELAEGLRLAYEDFSASSRFTRL